MKTDTNALISKFIEEFKASPRGAFGSAYRYLLRRLSSAEPSLYVVPSTDLSDDEKIKGSKNQVTLLEANLMQRKLEQAAGASYVSDLLAAVQDDIEAGMMHEFGADNHYTKAYREQEALYWYPALDWIDKLPQVSSVVDVGSAYGTLLLYANKQHKSPRLVAVDPCNYMSNILIERHGIQKINADFERQDVDCLGPFDLVLFTEVLEHLNFYPDSTLKKLHALLSDEGHLILTTPDAQEWGRVLDHYSSLEQIPPFNGQKTTWFDGHVWQYTHAEAVSVIEAAGFKIVDWAYSKGVAARHLCYLLKRSEKY
jgi:2-polyprenyl-3-methyl-5-hydroxy-6-metoxy-1,4-benzoquinol methylase